MRFLIILLLYIFAIASPPMFATDDTAGNTGSIVITITGLKNDKGVVQLYLFDDATKFDRNKDRNSGALKVAVVPIKARSATYTFAALPYRDYAIRFFHDEDSSGKFYVNLVGMPKVEYGYSNNVRGHFGPAKYKDAKFDLRSSEVRMDLRVAAAM